MKYNKKILSNYNTNLQPISGKALYPFYDMTKWICDQMGPEDEYCHAPTCLECLQLITLLAEEFTTDEDLNMSITYLMSLYLEASFLILSFLIL